MNDVDDKMAIIILLFRNSCTFTFDGIVYPVKMIFDILCFSSSNVLQLNTHFATSLNASNYKLQKCPPNKQQ